MVRISVWLINLTSIKPILGAILSLSAFIGFPNSSVSPEIIPPAPVIEQSTSTIKSLLVQQFGTSSPMVQIARCESNYRQFDGVVLLRGRENSMDVGIFQINEHYHLSNSQKLGIDIYSVEGNIAYAKYLYESEGTRPWNWSKGCWNK